MIVWRICKERHVATAFDGEGARRYPGRWNHKGVPMVYCTTTLSLAALEVFVHLDPGDLPDDLVSIRAELPDDIALEIMDAGALPSGWNQSPGPAALQDLGSGWIASSRGVALGVPSAIIPGELNVLLHPNHRDMARIARSALERFAFDPRMRR